MNKTELVAAIAETELTKKDADQALKAFIDVVGDELSKGEKIQLAGFGTLEAFPKEQLVTESTPQQKRQFISQLPKLLSSKL